MKQKMQKISLPRNMRIKKNKDGTFNIFTIKAKLIIPLRCLEKITVLTPSMVDYLKDYESRLNKDKEGKITDTKTLERIRTILSKPKLDKDPILDYDYRLPYQIERDKEIELERNKREATRKYEEDKKNAGSKR